MGTSDQLQPNITQSEMTEAPDTSADIQFGEGLSTAAIPKHASLEGLPAELKLSILRAAPSIYTLETLVRSSPLYHKVYLSDRKSILSEVVLRDIGIEVLGEALAIHAASELGFPQGYGGLEYDLMPFLSRYKLRREPGGRKDIVVNFLAQYKVDQSSSSAITPDSLDIRTLESLARLQSTVAKVASDFCESTLPYHPGTEEIVQGHNELSPNEKRRIYRAFYRCELFRVLFDDTRRFRTDDNERFDTMDQSFLFLYIFKTWEVEEMACVHDYMFRRHKEIYQECSSELTVLRPKKNLKDGEC